MDALVGRPGEDETCSTHQMPYLPGSGILCSHIQLFLGFTSWPILGFFSWPVHVFNFHIEVKPFNSRNGHFLIVCTCNWSDRTY